MFYDSYWLTKSYIRSVRQIKTVVYAVSDRTNSAYKRYFYKKKKDTHNNRCSLHGIRWKEW